MGGIFCFQWGPPYGPSCCAAAPGRTFLLVLPHPQLLMLCWAVIALTYYLFLYDNVTLLVVFFAGAGLDGMAGSRLVRWWGVCVG